MRPYLQSAMQPHSEPYSATFSGSSCGSSASWGIERSVAQQGTTAVEVSSIFSEHPAKDACGTSVFSDVPVVASCATVEMPAMEATVDTPSVRPSDPLDADSRAAPTSSLSDRPCWPHGLPVAVLPCFRTFLFFCLAVFTSAPADGGNGNVLEPRSSNNWPFRGASRAACATIKIGKNSAKTASATTRTRTSCCKVDDGAVTPRKT